MTPSQRNTYNRMLGTLKSIAHYESAEKLKRVAESQYGLSYEEVLEMAYENIVALAREYRKYKPQP